MHTTEQFVVVQDLELRPKNVCLLCTVYDETSATGSMSLWTLACVGSMYHELVQARHFNRSRARHKETQLSNRNYDLRRFTRGCAAFILIGPSTGPSYVMIGIRDTSPDISYTIGISESGDFFLYDEKIELNLESTDIYIYLMVVIPVLCKNASV